MSKARLSRPSSGMNGILQMKGEKNEARIPMGKNNKRIH